MFFNQRKASNFISLAQAFFFYSSFTPVIKFEVFRCVSLFYLMICGQLIKMVENSIYCRFHYL